MGQARAGTRLMGSWRRDRGMGKLHGHRQAPSSPAPLAKGVASGCTFPVGKADRNLGPP